MGIEQLAKSEDCCMAFLSISRYKTCELFAKILGSQFVAGFGNGLLFEAPLIAIQAIMPLDDVATAISTFSSVRNLATSLSVVLGRVIFQNSMDIRVCSLTFSLTNLPVNVTQLLSGVRQQRMLEL